MKKVEKKFKEQFDQTFCGKSWEEFSKKLPNEIQLIQEKVSIKENKKMMNSTSKSHTFSKGLFLGSISSFAVMFILFVVTISVLIPQLRGESNKPNSTNNVESVMTYQALVTKKTIEEGDTSVLSTFSSNGFSGTQVGSTIYTPIYSIVIQTNYDGDNMEEILAELSLSSLFKYASFMNTNSNSNHIILFQYDSSSKPIFAKYLMNFFDAVEEDKVESIYFTIVQKPTSEGVNE